MHDIILESAITTIMDHEDSVAAVDAEDKVLGYKNWLGLMKGNLQTEFEKGGRSEERRVGKSVDLGGRRIIKKKKKKQKQLTF